MFTEGKRFIKKLASVCLALLLALSGASALADMMQVVNCENWVSMREAPDTSSDWVVRVPLGDMVDALSYEGNFIYCTYNGYSGYILASYLSDNIATPGAGAQAGSAKAPGSGRRGGAPERTGGEITEGN